MSDICPSCGNYEKKIDAREDHVERFLEWLDEQDICLRHLGEEEVLDTSEVLHQHLESLVDEDADDDDEW